MSPDREHVDLLADALRQLADAATLVAAWLDDLDKNTTTNRVSTPDTRDRKEES